MQTMISIIAAVAANNVIGSQNDLPWSLPEDLKRFKKLTTGHTVIMGRRTYESIVARLGKPLPNRKNIVITRNKNYQVLEGVTVASSLDEALGENGNNDDRDKKIFIIGGEQVFKEGINKAETMYITEVKNSYEGDTYFPEIDKNKWNREIEVETLEYAFVVYYRKL